MKSDDPDFPTKLLSLKLLLRILQHIRDVPEKFGKILRRTIRELAMEPSPEKRLEVLKAIVYYLDRARPDAERFITIEYFKELEEEFVTPLEQIEARGIEKGRKR